MGEVAMPSKSAGWTTVAFGDVVQLSKERSSDPAADGYDRYIGLEHIDPGELRVRRWGDIANGVTFTSVFKPGQVLFGKRRAYQRKVAVADSSGVCSGDIYVLEPKGDALLPELLPFICQTDAFFEHAVGTSAGSLSPRTNWKSLATFEFGLPPIEEQKRMVTLLHAGLAVHGRLHDLNLNVSAVKEALVETRLRGLHLGNLTRNDRVGRYHTGWPLVPLNELLELSQYGLSAVAGDRGQYPMLRMMNFENETAVENDIVFIDLDDAEFERYRLRHGDVLFNRTNSYELVGRTGVYELSGDHVFASYLVRLRVKQECLDPAYLCSFLNASLGRRQVMSYATRGVSQTNVNASNLGRVLVPLPPLEYQRKTVSATRAITSAIASLRPRIAHVRRMLARVVEDGTAQ